MDLEKLIELFKVESLFAPAELKAIALGTIAHNHAIAARRGRPIYASSVTKDINQFSGLAGGVDMNNVMLMAMMNGQKQDKEAAKGLPEEAQAHIAKVLEGVSKRLTDIEASIASNKQP